MIHFVMQLVCVKKRRSLSLPCPNALTIRIDVKWAERGERKYTIKSSPDSANSGGFFPKDVGDASREEMAVVFYGAPFISLTFSMPFF